MPGHRLGAVRAGVLAGVLLLLWGCGPGESRSGESGSVGGASGVPANGPRPQAATVNFYNWSNYIHPDTLPGFSEDTGIKVKGADRVMLRLAKCCHPVPGDEIVGYVSLGRGITIHREDCRNVNALRKDAARFVDVRWEGDNEAGFLAEIHVDAWDRTRLLEDLSRTIGEQGASIVEAR